ncbi:MAG: hypothetical protein Q7K45_03470, partial [Nanoarchaeota archaeon]|nr:hypothetical protein [Nanoarchaeota archaeon]
RSLRFTLVEADGHESKQYIELPSTDWKEIYEQYYDLNWEKEVEPSHEPRVIRITQVEISNDDRKVGSSLNPFSSTSLESGKTLKPEGELKALLQGQDPFFQGLFKVLLSLSKEASTQFHNGKTLFAAGQVYMIGQYLVPLYSELLSIHESHNLAVDALKEAIKITQSVNFSDYPITKDLIDQLSQCLEQLVLKAIPEGSIVFKSIHESEQTSWLNFKTDQLLMDISEDILKETRSSWLIMDEGNKIDWNTLQLYKGYSQSLSKLYRWYGHQYEHQLGAKKYTIEQASNLLDEMKTSGDDIQTSWTTGLSWSDQYLRDFAAKFQFLHTLLSENK